MYHNSKRTILFPLLLTVGVLSGLFLGLVLGRTRAESHLKGLLQQVASPNDKLSYTLALIERHYIDSIGRDSLIEVALPLLISELDPHSNYIPRREMQAVNEPLEGEFDGIGVVFNMATDTVVVLNVVRSGPSDKAGVRAGDRSFC